MTAPLMLSQPMKALVLLDVEPLLDGPNPAAARAALEGSGLVVALTPFSDAAADYADVMLPIAPFAETSGSFVNAEGHLQSFHGVVKPRGETRPAWKVLRVLGNLLGLEGFEFETSEAVRDEAVRLAGPIASRLDNTPAAAAVQAGGAGQAGLLERIADVPIYQSDSLVRRAASLQATADALAPAVALPTVVWQALGLRAGDRVVVSQGAGSATLVAAHDATLASTVVRVSAARNETADLGPMFGPISVKKAG